MKRLTLTDIYELAVKEYEVDFSKTPKTFKDSARRTIRRIAKVYPKPGVNSYYSRAKGESTNPREFTPTAARKILEYCRPYFSKYSSNEYIQTGEKYKDSVAQAEAARKYANNKPTYEDLKEAARLAEEKEIEDDFNAYYSAMHTAFYLKNGREATNDEEVLNSDLEPVYVDEDPAPPDPVSKDALELFNNDYHYTLRYDNPEDPHMITGVVERPYDEAIEIYRTKRHDIMIEALYDLFFEPIKEEEIIEDIYMEIDPHIEHWDETFFANRDKLKNVRSYCHLREDSVLEEFLENRLSSFKRELFAVIKAYFGDDYDDDIDDLYDNDY